MRFTMVAFVIIAVIVAFLTFFIQPKDARPQALSNTTTQHRLV